MQSELTEPKEQMAHLVHWVLLKGCLPELQELLELMAHLEH